MNAIIGRTPPPGRGSRAIARSRPNERALLGWRSRPMPRFVRAGAGWWGGPLVCSSLVPRGGMPRGSRSRQTPPPAPGWLVVGVPPRDAGGRAAPMWTAGLIMLRCHRALATVRAGDRGQHADAHRSGQGGGCGGGPSSPCLERGYSSGIWVSERGAYGCGAYRGGGAGGGHRGRGLRAGRGPIPLHSQEYTTRAQCAPVSALHGSIVRGAWHCVRVSPPNVSANGLLAAIAGMGYPIYRNKSTYSD